MDLNGNIERYQTNMNFGWERKTIEIISTKSRARQSINI